VSILLLLLLPDRGSPGGANKTGKGGLDHRHITGDDIYAFLVNASLSSVESEKV
jgi:hypothetical protein